MLARGFHFVVVRLRARKKLLDLSKWRPLGRLPLKGRYKNHEIVNKKEVPVQYTLMFYLSPEEFAARTDPAKKDAFWGAFVPYAKALFNAGIVVGGAGLEAPDTAATVRLEDGRPLVQDGPFAATKEQLGGFFLIEVPDFETALSWAARYPAGPGGGVEVRAAMPKME